MSFNVQSCASPLSSTPLKSPETTHELTFDDPFSAAEGVIAFYKEHLNSNLNLCVSFDGYTVNLEITVCQELTAPLNDEDRRKWYWKEHLKGSLSQVNMISIKAPNGTRSEDIDYTIDPFGMSLSEYFFNPVRMKDSTKVPYNTTFTPPLSYKPLITTAYQR